MKGLLVKDFLLLRHQKQMMILLGIACVILIAFSFVIGGSFLIGYATILSTLIATGTISQDRADNGMLFLMTMPFSRKNYALSKYVLGGILCTGSWLVTNGIMVSIYTIRGVPLSLADNVIPSFVFILMSVLMLDITIPLQLKYGPEKSRIILMLIFGAALGSLSVFLFVNVTQIPELEVIIDQVADLRYAIAAVLVCAVLTVVSIHASIRIMEKKTF